MRLQALPPAVPWPAEAASKLRADLEHERQKAELAAAINSAHGPNTYYMPCQHGPFVPTAAQCSGAMASSGLQQMQQPRANVQPQQQPRAAAAPPPAPHPTPPHGFLPDDPGPGTVYFTSPYLSLTVQGSKPLDMRPQHDLATKHLVQGSVIMGYQLDPILQQKLLVKSVVEFDSPAHAFHYCHARGFHNLLFPCPACHISGAPISSPEAAQAHFVSTYFTSPGQKWTPPGTLAVRVFTLECVSVQQDQGSVQQGQHSAAPTMGPGTGPVPIQMDRVGGAASGMTPPVAGGGAASGTSGMAPVPGEMARDSPGTAHQFADTVSSGTPAAPEAVHIDHGVNRSCGSNQPLVVKVDAPGFRQAKDVLATFALSEHLAPAGVPLGPLFVSHDDLKLHIAAWILTLPGGSWDIALGRSRPTNPPPGIHALSGGKSHRAFKCAGSNECTWHVTYEWTMQGWVLQNYSPHVCKKHKVFIDNKEVEVAQSIPENHHSHELCQSVSAMRAMHGGQTNIIPEMKQMGHLFAAAGLSASHIVRLFNTYAAQNMLDASEYEYDKVYREFVLPLRKEKVYDLRNTVTLLEERKLNKQLQFECRVDGTGHVEGLFVELAGGMGDWALGGEDNVMLFDPTWGMNMWNMKCCCFVSISPSGKSSILAFALLISETKELFEWSFYCFSKVFRTPPRIVCTDSDEAIAKALLILKEDVWPDMCHLLCVYHISKNVYKHLYPLFGSSIAEWRAVLHEFWRIAKQSDLQSLDTFDSEWAAWVALIRDGASAEDEKVEKGIQWMESRLRVNKHKWALRYTWQQMTCGIHSSQRAESIHSVIKIFHRQSALVTDLVRHLESENERIRSKGEIQTEVLRLRNDKKHQTSYPFVASMKPVLSPYGFLLLLQQEVQAKQYICPTCREPTLDADEDFDGMQTAVHDDDTVFRPFHLDDHHLLPVSSRKDGEYTQYAVQRMSPDVATVRPLQIDATGEIATHECDEDQGVGDQGVGDMALVRRATLYWCSCQWSKAHGGIPCRHMIRVCVQENVSTYNTSAIHPRYLNHGATEQAEMVDHLYSTAAPIPGFNKAGIFNEASGTQTIFPGEQRTVLMRQCTSLVDVVISPRARDEAFEQAYQLLRALTLEVLNTGKLRVKLTSSGHPAARHVQQQAAQDATGEATSGNCTDNGVPEAEVVTVRDPTKDEKDLTESIGLTSKLAPLPDAVPPLLGKAIAFKTLAKGRGGWFVGNVTKVYDPNVDQPDNDTPRRPASLRHVNVLVHYPQSDDKTEGHMLSLSNMVSDANAAVHSWGLVVASELSNYHDRPTVLNPCAAGLGRGRPQTKRKGPACGPCGNSAAQKQQRQAARAAASQSGANSRTAGGAAASSSSPSSSPSGPS